MKYFQIVKENILPSSTLIGNSSDAGPHLSPAELSVLALILRGSPLVDIALKLRLSPKTVSTYKARLMVKLHAKSNTDLVMTGMLAFGVEAINLTDEDLKGYVERQR